MEDLIASLHTCLKNAFSPVALQLLQETSRDDADFGRIGSIIRMDPAISAAVLNLANSSFYSFAERVLDMKRAAVALGSKEILKIALAVSFLKQVGDRLRERRTDIFGNWRLMVWAAVAAELLAERMCPEKSDVAYLGALFKDMALMLFLCEDPQALAACREGDKPLFCCEAEDITRERKAWGGDHGQIARRLLSAWGIPEDILPAVELHHDFEHLDLHPPMVQAVILATRWAEMELGCAGTPPDVVQFEMLLKSRLGMGDHELDALRSICATRFTAMLSMLGVSESEPGEHYYQHGLAALQQAYFLGMEIMNVPGGLSGVARTVTRQLRWSFGVQRFELALKNSTRPGYRLYSCMEDSGLVESGEAAELSGFFWLCRDRGLPLYAHGVYLGELRFPLAETANEAVALLPLYVRFLSHGFEHYVRRQAVLEMKAQTLDLLPMGVARVEPGGQVIECNRRLRQFFGLGECPRGQDMLTLLRRVLGVDIAVAWEDLAAGRGRGSMSRIFCGIPGDLGAGDESACLYLSASRVVWDGRDEVLLLIEDVTEITEHQAQAIRQLDFLEQLMGSMRELVLTLDGKFRIAYASASEARHLVGEEFFQVARPVDMSGSTWGPEILAERLRPFEAVLKLSYGVLRPLELVISPLRGPGGEKSWLVVGRDLTEVRRLEERLRRQAIYDGLTGLFNREQFMMLLERETVRSVRTGRQLGLIFFDLDGFKKINDTRGHQADDEFLARLGKILQANVRAGMDYPCRYGGDEFAVIYTEVERSQLEAVAVRIRKVMETEFKGELGCSAGLAMHKDKESTAAFLKRADAASYAAKAKGGDRFLWAG